jgi:hypothetical protein
MQAPHDDLFYLDEEHPDWQLINANHSMVEISDDEGVVESYKSFYQNVALGNAFTSKAGIHQSTIKRYIWTSLYASYYFFFKNRRLEQNEFFCANPDLDLAREIWNLLESKYLKRVLKKFL